MVRQRVRIRFTKQDDLRWLSHRDLVRAWERLLRRAEVPLGMTEGFHPKPRMNFPSALAVGIAGLNELVEIELSAPWSAEQLREALAPHLPPGLSVEKVEVMPPEHGKAQAVEVEFQAILPPERQSAAAERVEWLASAAVVSDPARGAQRPAGFAAADRGADDSRGRAVDAAAAGSTGERSPAGSARRAGSRRPRSSRRNPDANSRGGSHARSDCHLAPLAHVAANPPDVAPFAFFAESESFRHEAGNADQRFAAGRMPDRDRGRRRPGRALHRAHQPGQLRRQYLQGKSRQHRAEHPSGVRRFRRRPQRLLAHQRHRAAILPPRRLRSRQADRIGRRGSRRGRAMAVERPRDGDPMRRRRRRRPTNRRRRSADGGVRRPHARPLRPAPARASSRRSKTSSAAATKCSCRSSRKASAPRGRRSPPTSAFPAAIWC